MVGTLFVIEALKEGIIGILLTLDTMIYWLIAGAFKIFMAIAGARLLSSSAYTEIANKIYIIVGVVMLFVLSYAMLRGIIDPDKETKGEFGSKMLGRIVTAVIGLAIAPFLFNFMYQLQGKILEDDIIGKLFFRIESKDKYDLSGTVDVDGSSVNYGDTETNPDEYVKSIGGAVTAVNLWQAFFFPSESSGLTAAEIEADAGEYFASALGNAALCAGGIALGAAATSIPVVGWVVGPILMVGTAVTACMGAVNNFNAGNTMSNISSDKVTLEQAYNMASGTGEFTIFTVFLKNYAEKGEITYLFLISTIAGLFALYAFVSFSIDMGVRAAMLAYLQIIAPIPLILQVLPKFKDNLNKYISKVLGTFMEVFVRISVVYVVVYIICHLTELFGSVSTWQQQNGLSPVQQVLALALLILGLIAFSRKAPEIISETLNLPKGNMSLGIGKKLADGGFYSGSSIVGSGVQSAVNRWNNAKAPDGGTANMRQKAGEALKGLGLGTARAFHSNFIGPDHKEAKTRKEAQAITRRTSEGVGATLNADAERKARNFRYNEQMEKFKKDMDKADADMATHAHGSPEYNEALARYEEAKKNYYEARSKALENTVIGAAITDLENKTKMWAVGAVDTRPEEETMKYGNALDSLKGNLREEAYKKNHGVGGAATIKQQYDALKSAPINEYKTGWDEQSANAAYRSRKADIDSVSTVASVAAAQSNFTTQQATYDAAETALKTAKTDLDQALASNDATRIAAAQATYTTAQTNYTAAQAAVQTALTNLNNELHSNGVGANINYVVGATGNLEIDMSDIKVDMTTAMQQRDAQLEGLRIAMEAAADAWVQEQAQDKSSNTYAAIQKFISDQATYISQNASTQLVVGYDEHNNPIYETLETIMEKGFGKGAVDGKFNPDEAFKDTRGYELETKDKRKLLFKYDKASKTYKGTDPSGQALTLTQEEMIKYISENVTNGKISKASVKNAITEAADKGKTASRHVANNEYAEKIQRKSDLEQGKK